MKNIGILLCNNLRKKSSFFFLQAKFLRTKKLRCSNNTKKLYEDKDNENTYQNEELPNGTSGKNSYLKIENNNNKHCHLDKDEELKKKYEELKKKLYKKYNYYEIESDPHNIYLHGKNYDEINELNIHKMLLLGLKKIHINELSEMQISSFLTIQQGKDLVLNYPDGSGKTIAYLLPILNNLYFLHDYLEKIILDSYNEKNNNYNNNINCIENNYKFNNNFNLYEEMDNYLLKYSHYKNNVFFEDNLDIHKKMKEKFHLLPPCFDKLNEESFKNIGRKKRRNKNINSLNLANDINISDTLSTEVNKNSGNIQNISIMNKLIEIIKINNIKLSNLNSNYNNEQELKKLDRILKYNEKNNEDKDYVTHQNHSESIYRYLTVNPLQINKSVIILTVNKDNINQIINVIKQLDILKRINIQTLNDVPYTCVSSEIEKENFNDYIKENFNLENLQVEKFKQLNNEVLCNEQIMWSYADILITTPDIFLNSFKNNTNSNILPSIIIFDEIDMLFQNNAYRNTMMNIFKLIKKRPEIYNPHIDVSDENIAYINKSIENILINEEKVSNNSCDSFQNEKNIINNYFNSKNNDTSTNYEYVKVGEDFSQKKLKIYQEKKNNSSINGNNDCYSNSNKGIKRKNDDMQLIQLIYVCSTLPSVGHTTAGSMLTERFNNLVEIVSKSNYKIPKNIHTQWIELNKEKIINLYLFNNDNKTKKSVNLKDFSLSNKINEFENASFEHRLDLLIYILKKYYERTINYKVNKNSQNYKGSNNLNKNNEEKKMAYNSSSKYFHLIDRNPIYKTIVFVNNIKDCIKIYNFLKKHNWPVFSFHKNLSLNSRIKNLYNFYYSKFCILITTDLISRGIDTKNIDHVINFHFPSDAITYIHRLGKINRLNSYINKMNEYNCTINDNTLKEKSLNNNLNSFLKKNKEKSFLVTNFISSTNLLLADSIRKFQNNNISLLSLFSRKKSFKMKNKRNNSENANNRYIDMTSMKEIELDVNDHKLNTLLQLNDENKDDIETNNCSNVSYINEESSSYIQAPFTIFSLEDSESDEEEKFECKNKNTTNDNNIKYENISNIYTNKIIGKSNIKENREMILNENDKENKQKKYISEKNSCYDNLYGNYINSISQKKQLNENKLEKFNISNNSNIPSWDDVKFDHKKFVVERFKSKSCYLVSQVKRGKLILNSFENNNNDDELLF
ncbi:DEAD/DEAH box helicase, putative [Plasmodium relictum]|uniref:DEAD/DEAH box helicase, putative n=1 Tax=Plasmodium relictum TaxID=85471 RepID=A0A1J1H4V6_PLARL|nr:DEAD/DEAH box helicase, putative [Plasmodium relictum]CRG99942.1 DEAD/DEAH box helicase, putative [Plasmodium relictum]